MIFQNPAALWAFLAFIPLIIIYFLKVKPQKLETTTLFLWDKVITKKKHESLFSKLKNLLSLLIILLALSASILAMAQPVFKEKNESSKVLLIVDNSASMNSKLGSETRLDKALAHAEDFIENLNEHQEVTLASLAGQLKVHIASTSNPIQVKKALEAIQPSNEALNAKHLVELQKHQGPETQTVLISDLCFKGAEDLKDLQTIAIKAEAQNLAITAFDLMRPLSNKKQINAYVEILSTFEETQNVDLVLYHKSLDNPVKILPLEIQSGLNKPEIFSILSEENGAWFVSLAHESDQLALDNTAYFQLDPPADIKTSLEATASNEVFYRNALSLFSKIGDSSAKVIHLAHGEASNTAQQQLIFKPQGESIFWNSLSPVETNQLVKSTEEPDAVLRYCDLEGLSFTGVQEIELKENARVLLESMDGLPLIVQSFEQGRSAYILNFDPEESNLFLNIQFPVLLYSLIRDSYYHNKADLRRNYVVGERLNLENSSQWQSPLKTPLNLNESKELQLTEAGFYEVTFKDGSKQKYSVSLLNKTESQIKKVIEGAQVTQIRNYPLRTYLLIFAIVLFVLESMLYHRRKIG